jgi:hypothetical protein
MSLLLFYIYANRLKANNNLKIYDDKNISYKINKINGINLFESYFLKSY